MGAVSLLAVELFAYNEGICSMKLVFWDVMSFTLEHRRQHFGGTGAYPADGGSRFL
jgi:hypothetical protein